MKVLAANGDDATQLSQAEQLISQGVDVLVVIAHNAEATAPIVDKAHKEGIKVIAYDRMINNAEVDYYISFDNVRVGELQAQAVTAAAQKGNIVYIGGADTDNNAHMFKEGAMNVLKPLEEKGDIKIVYDQFSKDWKPEEALKNMENALTANKNDVQGVVAANDATAGGADPGVDRAGHGRQSSGFRAGRRLGRRAADRRGHTADDGLQADQIDRHQSRGNGRIGRQGREHRHGQNGEQRKNRRSVGAAGPDPGRQKQPEHGH
ncbi:hypothetical protein HMSSN036_95330 [Paenibacillus macerans]|nr:hypothetical protein HMSSN036_95330 [Paenibacillus macerans]